MSAKVKASEVQAESAKEVKDEAVKVTEAEAAKKAEAEAKVEKEAQAVAAAKAKADKEAQAKAEQAEAEAEKAKASQAEPVALKPWNGEPLMPAPEGETVENDKPEPITPAKKSGKTYRAQWTLYHDNQRYTEGDTLTLSDDDAEDLVDVGVLVAVK